MSLDLFSHGGDNLRRLEGNTHFSRYGSSSLVKESNVVKDLENGHRRQRGNPSVKGATLGGTVGGPTAVEVATAVFVDLAQ